MILVFAALSTLTARAASPGTSSDASAPTVAGLAIVAPPGPPTEASAPVVPGKAIVALLRDAAEHSDALARGDAARAALLAEDERTWIRALPPGAGPLVHALSVATDGQLMALPADVSPDAVVARLAVAGAPVNPWIGKLAEVPSVAWAWTLRAVQPAVVRIIVGRYGGTGVNLDPAGNVLTNAHVVGPEGTAAYVEFPDGTGFTATVTRVDERRDLALLALPGGVALPIASIAAAPPVVGEPVVVIGHPGRGPAPPFQVSWGTIRAFRLLRDGDQSLGATSHDASTDWGHSGSPLFDATGRIVALHNSWDPETAMRHAVSWEAIVSFLAGRRE